MCLECEKKSLVKEVWTLRHKCKESKDNMNKQCKENDRLSLLLKAKTTSKDQRDKQKLVAGPSCLRHDYQQITHALVKHLKECDNQIKENDSRDAQVQQLFAATATTQGKLKLLEKKYNQIEQADGLKNAMPSKKFLIVLKDQLSEYENNAKTLRVLKRQHKAHKQSTEKTADKIHNLQNKI